MSVLSFPRIYFKGYAQWDPCTFNNNDWQAFPTYNGFSAALNWPFLATQNPPDGITPGNFVTKFRPWAIQLQNDNVDSPAGPRVAAEWNMFGSHAAGFVQYQDKITTITGGDLAFGKSAAGDSIIGKPVAINGDDSSTPARLVDTNPASFWSSQIYYGGLQVGSGNQMISGPRAVRMHSRWINLKRIYSATGELTQPAAAVACCFQACIPYQKIDWQNAPDPSTGSTSQLIANLQRAAAQPGAQGVMMRFTAYVNLYFQNGIFNGTSQQPRNYPELAKVLAAAWDAWNKTGDSSQFFSQQCYSHVVGAVGVWNDSELASVPGGRYLSALNPVTPLNGSASTALGPVAVNVDCDQNLVSLDFGSAIPEVATPKTSTSDLTKANFGTLSLGTLADGTFTGVTDIPYSQYQRSAYEASAGIIDLALAPEAIEQLQSGLLAIQVQGQTIVTSQPDVRDPEHAKVTTAVEGPLVALAEQGGGYSAQTDSRGIYLDENQTKQFQVSVFLRGIPAPGAQVLIVKYDNNLSLVPLVGTQFVNFANGDQRIIQVSGTPAMVTMVTADLEGVATIDIRSQSPGFPVLAFFPFAAGQPLPQPPAALFPPGNAFYATVRVLPFDSAVPGQFIALWNATHDPDQAWTFIYNQVLYIYDMLFNVMLEYVNLGSRTEVEKNIPSILHAISKQAAAESTRAMPVTRDMSAGKRTALQLWIYLVQHGYQVPSLSLAMLDRTP